MKTSVTEHFASTHHVFPWWGEVNVITHGSRLLAKRAGQFPPALL
jgi:hypothetical protein